jgi:peptidoglycan/xylan/chitin deacetylase (PgdA/CDA1 family)
VVTGRVVTRLPTSRKVVALTFDAGSGAEAVASVVATLTRERVPATFFLTGEFADLHPAAAAGLARRGLVGTTRTRTHTCRS